MGKKLMGALAIVVILAVVGVYWFVIRDDAPEELGLDTSSNRSEPAGTTPESFDGEWVVRTGGDTTAGFRIDEEFAGAISHTAVGRSPAVDGSLTVEGTEASAADITVDLTELEFTDDPPTGSVGNRAGAMESNGLQTNDFPDASFSLTQPIDLGGEPAQGFSTTTEATGELTLHGVPQEITLSVDAQVQGDTIEIATTDPVPIVLADYDIEVRSPPFIANISGEGSFEFLLVFEKA